MARWPAQLRKCPTPSTPLSYQLTQLLHSGVAVGSSIGHAVGGWFGGGSSAPAEQQQAEAANPDTVMSQSYQAPQVCANDVNNFRKCMDDNQGSLTICGWYLDQLKSCQAAASQY